MDVRYQRFVRHDLTPAEVSEVSRVDALATELRDHLDAKSDEIDVVHVHLAQSLAVQRIVGSLLEEVLGFAQEVVLRPEEGFVTHARPDFFFDLGDGRGVLAEVERGGTVANNHDLKDLWKTHIALDAQHLFLVVPNANWNSAGQPREHPFARVVHRLGSFFGDARREVDVVSVHVFGYGRDL